MDIFSSDRERNLWLWAAVVVATIYSTVGLAQTLAWMLEEHSILDAVYVFGLLLIIAMIATQAFRTRPSGTGVIVALGVAAVYVLLFVRLTLPAERTHLMEYGVVGVLLYEALSERARQGRRVPLPALLAIAATGTLGLGDECLQLLIPSRVFDLRDVVVNVLAGAMAVGASAVIANARRD